MTQIVKIAVVAPASPLARQTAEKVCALAVLLYGKAAPEIYFHAQCFLSDGHFAGSDSDRSMAFLDVANDGVFDAVWFARGGYGSCRIEEHVFAKLNEAARRKIYLGYSDMGSLLARLYAENVGWSVHGPMPQDINRANGEQAVARALSYLVDRDPGALEPTARAGKKVAAFNLMTLSHLLSAPWKPDFSEHILMLEEVSEYHYRIDRAMFTVTSDESIRRAAGIMLGRCSDIPDNDVNFGKNEEEICRYWCERASIPYLGRADIGHDSANKVVPFGAGLAA
jgi:muramoyltetrapeptide carboxypeptidase